MLSNPLHWSRPKKLVILTAVASFFLLTLYGLRRDSFDDGFQLSWQSLSGSPRDKCPPLAYALGQWEWAPKTNITKMTDKHQITTFGGFHSCAADREYDWHLGTDQQEKFSRSPKVQSYAWKPSSRCVNLRPMDSASIVKDLVEKGSWYLVGGSSSHFPTSPLTTSRFGHGKPFLLLVLHSCAPRFCNTQLYFEPLFRSRLASASLPQPQLSCCEGHHVAKRLQHHRHTTRHFPANRPHNVKGGTHRYPPIHTTTQRQRRQKHAFQRRGYLDTAHR